MNNLDPDSATEDDIANLRQDDVANIRTLIDVVRPEQLLEIAQMQMGELVMFGVVVALGLSGHAHGLKQVRLPILAALVPGLPTPFAVVWYFLLETRQTHGGGTLLPLHGAGAGLGDGGAIRDPDREK